MYINLLYNFILKTRKKHKNYPGRVLKKANDVINNKLLYNNEYTIIANEYKN